MIPEETGYIKQATSEAPPMARNASGASGTDRVAQGNVKSSFLRLVKVVPFTFVIPPVVMAGTPDRHTKSFRHSQQSSGKLFVKIVYNGEDEIPGTVLFLGVSVNTAQFTVEVSTNYASAYSYQGLGMIYELLIG